MTIQGVPPKLPITSTKATGIYKVTAQKVYRVRLSGAFRYGWGEAAYTQSTLPGLREEI